MSTEYGNSEAFVMLPDCSGLRIRRYVESEDSKTVAAKRRREIHQILEECVKLIVTLAAVANTTQL